MIAFKKTGKALTNDFLVQLLIVAISEDGKLLNTQQTINLPHYTYPLPAGWSRNNTIGFHFTNPRFQAIYTVPFPGGKATQVTPEGWANNPCWSADGKKILFRWKDQIRSIPEKGGESSIIPIETAEKTFEALPGGGNHISPDGRSLLFAGGSPKQEEGGWLVHLMVMPVEGGVPTVITQSPSQDRFPCWSPDGKHIAFIRDSKDSKGNIVINIYTVPVSGGDVKQITSDQDSIYWSSIRYTPDGKHIACYSKNKSIKLVPIEGGASREFVKVNSLNNHDEIIMLIDGKHMAYTAEGKIWMVPLSGGEPVQIETGLSDWYHSQIAQSPDGKTIAFTAFTGGDSDLWLMENFLPVFESKK
jgi:Tol biopolymer transport system component